MVAGVMLQLQRPPKMTFSIRAFATSDDARKMMQRFQEKKHKQAAKKDAFNEVQETRAFNFFQ